MNRRKFNQTIIAATAGITFSPKLANGLSRSSSNILLGGPVFKKFNSPEEWIVALQDLNYRAAYCPVDPGVDSATINAYKNAAKQAEIVISEVGAWSNPIDPDSTKSKAAIEKCIHSLELANEIGANCCVNISGSRNPNQWAGPHKDNLIPETFDLVVETTRKIIDTVNPTHTFFALEAMPWAYPDSVESYQKLIKAIDRKQLGVHLDPVNLVVSPQIYFKNGEMIKHAIKMLGPNIKSCHAKDILLMEDKLTPYLPEVRIGLGNLDYRVFLTELNKLNPVPLMLEHLNSAEEYQLAANHLREVGKELYIFL